MRAMFMVMASILLAAGLFGCNQKTETTAAVATATPPAPPAALPPPPPAPPPEPEPSRRLHRFHRTHYASLHSAAPYMGHGHVSTASYAEQSYDDSDGSYADGPYADGPDVYAEERGSDDGDGFDGPPPEPVWTDGHGRAHYATPYDGDQPAETPDDRRARRAPYHGWNSDCDRGGS